MDSLDSPEVWATFETDDAPAVPWWTNGNDLALIDAIRKSTRGNSEAETVFFSHLIGAARVAGLTDEQIQAAWSSDRNLVIYEP